MFVSDGSNGSMEIIKKLSCESYEASTIDPELYTKYNVKRGLRNADNTGVLVGLTNVGDVRGYIMEENEKYPLKESSFTEI